MISQDKEKSEISYAFFVLMFFSRLGCTFTIQICELLAPQSVSVCTHVQPNNKETVREKHEKGKKK